MGIISYTSYTGNNFIKTFTYIFLFYTYDTLETPYTYSHISHLHVGIQRLRSFLLEESSDDDEEMKLDKGSF